MLPHTRDFTRDGCTVGARLVTYRQLENDYVCNDCGGRVVTRAQWDERRQESIYFAQCAECGAEDFVSARQYDKQCADFPLIVRGLPPELRELFDVEPAETVSAVQAISELFDL